MEDGLSPYDFRKVIGSALVSAAATSALVAILDLQAYCPALDTESKFANLSTGTLNTVFEAGLIHRDPRSKDLVRSYGNVADAVILRVPVS